jgi:hypothetical protein
MRILRLQRFLNDSWNMFVLGELISLPPGSEVIAEDSRVVSAKIPINKEGTIAALSTQLSSADFEPTRLGGSDLAFKRGTTLVWGFVHGVNQDQSIVNLGMSLVQD